MLTGAAARVFILIVVKADAGEEAVVVAVAPFFLASSVSSPVVAGRPALFSTAGEASCAAAYLTTSGGGGGVVWCVVWPSLSRRHLGRLLARAALSRAHVAFSPHGIERENAWHRLNLIFHWSRIVHVAPGECSYESSKPLGEKNYLFQRNEHLTWSQINSTDLLGNK